MPRFRGRRPRIPQDERLELVRTELTFSRKHRDTAGVTSMWNELIDNYQGKFFDYDNPLYDDEIVVNDMFALLNVMWPSVSIKEPTISVLPRRSELEDHAVLTEALVAYSWETIGAQTEMRSAVRDFLMLGMGWVKVGWEFAEKLESLSPDQETEEIAKLIGEADALVASQPELADAAPTDEQIAEQVVGSKRSVVVTDDPYVERVNPFEMFVNAEATSLDNARWVCQRQIRTLEEARADKRYSQSVRLKLEAEDIHSGANYLTREERDRYSSAVDRVVIWEFYDLEREEMMAFSEHSEGYLIKPTPIPYHVGHPFVLVRNYLTPNHFYAQGELEQVKPLVEEKIATRSQMVNQRRKYNRKMIAHPKAFDDEGRRALASDRDNEVAFTRGNWDRSLDQAVIAAPQIPMAADLYAMDQVTADDINRISGVSEYLRGQVPDSRQTATEAAMIQDATNARQAEKLNQVETFIADIAAKLLGVMQQYMTTDRPVRVAGADGQELWFNASPEDIEGEYLFKVQAGSTQPTNEVTRRTNAISMVQVLAPFIEMGLVDPAHVVKHVLQEGFDVRNPQKFFTQQGAASVASPDAPGGIGNNPELQGEQGIQAPQLDPRELVALQQESSGSGIPDALASQLAGQVGLNL